MSLIGIGTGIAAAEANCHTSMISISCGLVVFENNQNSCLEYGENVKCPADEPEDESSDSDENCPDNEDSSDSDGECPEDDSSGSDDGDCSDDAEEVPADCPDEEDSDEEDNGEDETIDDPSPESEDDEDGDEDNLPDESDNNEVPDNPQDETEDDEDGSESEEPSDKRGNPDNIVASPDGGSGYGEARIIPSMALEIESPGDEVREKKMVLNAIVTSSRPDYEVIIEWNIKKNGEDEITPPRGNKIEVYVDDDGVYDIAAKVINSGGKTVSDEKIVTVCCAEEMDTDRFSIAIVQAAEEEKSISSSERKCHGFLFYYVDPFEFIGVSWSLERIEALEIKL